MGFFEMHLSKSVSWNPTKNETESNNKIQLNDTSLTRSVLYFINLSILKRINRPHKLRFSGNCALARVRQALSTVTEQLIFLSTD